MKTLIRTLCGAILMAFSSFSRAAAGETDPAFNEFVQQIKAIYTRHPGQALSETESAEVYRLKRKSIAKHAWIILVLIASRVTSRKASGWTNSTKSERRWLTSRQREFYPRQSKTRKILPSFSTLAITVKADFEWHPQKPWGHPAFGLAS